MTKLDRRLNAFRPDLADTRLKGQVEATSFAEGRPARVIAPVADLRSRASPDAGLDSQLIAGDEVMIFEDHEGWAWVQAVRDGYVGYAPSWAIATDAPAPTHRVRVPRSFVYREPDMKRPMVMAHSIGAAIAVTGEAETRGTIYALLGDGSAMVADHLEPISATHGDFVSITETLDGTPYLWGGASAFGIDCSGLVQLALRLCGQTVLRDTDMQAASIGTPLMVADDLSGLRRGDLVFWKGHVAIMRDDDTIIHANGRTMMVNSEPLAEAVERIAPLYGRPTGFRRL